MTLTFCLGFGTHKNFISLFDKAWRKLLKQVKPKAILKSTKPPFDLIQLPDLSPSEVRGKSSHMVAIRESIGKISADVVCPYPPGIPLLISGERIDKDKVDWLLEQSLYSNDLVNSYIRVLK